MCLELVLPEVVADPEDSPGYASHNKGGRAYEQHLYPEHTLHLLQSNTTKTFLTPSAEKADLITLRLGVDGVYKNVIPCRYGQRCRRRTVRHDDARGEGEPRGAFVAKP